MHQFELHPYLQQTEFVEWHKDNGIKVTAYSPLANTNSEYRGPGGGKPGLLLENEVISNMAKRRGCTNAQVALTWGRLRYAGVIVKSSDENRIEENYESSRCRLQAEDRVAIKELGVKLWRFSIPLHWHLHPHLFEALENSEPHDN